MSGYVFVCSDEAQRHEGVELPIEEDGTILLSVLQSQFEGSSGLKYRNPTTGGWRAVKIAGEVLHPPEGGWSDIVYVVVTPPVKPEPATESEPVTEVKDEEQSATTVVTAGDQSAAMEGYKRKMDDQEGSRAAKNPRSSSPTFSSLESSQQYQPPQQVQDLNREDLIILGLEWTVNDAELKRYFEQFGEVAAAEVKKDIDTGRSRGFGFVRYFDNEIQKNVQGMKHVIKGRKVDVKFPKKSSSYLPSKLFVGCLPLRPEVTREELEEYFGQFGELADVYIPNPYRGFGFVSFQDAAVAHKVLNAPHTLRKSTLNISLADPKGSKVVHSYPYPTYDPYQHYYDTQLFRAQQETSYGYASSQHPTAYGYATGYAPRQPQPSFPRGPPATQAQHVDTAMYQQARPSYQEGYAYQPTRPRGPPPPPPPQSQAQRMQQQQQAQHEGQVYSQAQYTGESSSGSAQYNTAGGSSQYSYGSQGYSYSSEGVGYGTRDGGQMKQDGQETRASPWQHY